METGLVDFLEKTTGEAEMKAKEAETAQNRHLWGKYRPTIDWHAEMVTHFFFAFH